MGPYGGPLLLNKIWRSGEHLHFLWFLFTLLSDVLTGLLKWLNLLMNPLAETILLGASCVMTIFVLIASLYVKRLKSQRDVAQKSATDSLLENAVLVQENLRLERLAFQISVIERDFYISMASHDTQRSAPLNTTLQNPEGRSQAILFGISAINAGVIEALRVGCLKLETMGKGPMRATICAITDWGTAETGLDGVKLKRLYSDPSSACELVEKDYAEFGIDDDSLTKAIFREGLPLQTLNDLQALERQGKYFNKNSGWQSRMNAACAVSISSMGEENGLKRTGALRFESLNGKFDKESEVELQKIAARVGYLLYQITMFREALRSLPNLTRSE